jgi:hypothetical protein
MHLLRPVPPPTVPTSSNTFWPIDVDCAPNDRLRRLAHVCYTSGVPPPPLSMGASGLFKEWG